MDKSFKPTVSWMAEKYQEMNSWLFNSELGHCEFSIFTTGPGSQGGVLGWFSVTNSGIRVSIPSRRMYLPRWNENTYVDSSNFVELCRPKISINGNYSGTENGFLATLVHEMCHYYTYMNGYCPKQAHGREFKEIGYVVSSKSNGLFTIQRLASAEDMKNLELSDEMKARKEKRLNNKKSSVTAVISFYRNGEVRLSITSNQNLVNVISTSEEERGNKVVISNDSDVIDFLFKKGYNKNFRTWRYWNLEGKPWLDELKSMLPETSGQTLSVKRPEPEVVQKQPKRIFSVKTSNGTFECDASSYFSLFKKLKERFHNLSDTAINNLINNQNNYRMEESRNRINAIVESVIKEYIEEYNNSKDEDETNSIELTPGMNLGLNSPLEEI